MEQRKIFFTGLGAGLFCALIIFLAGTGVRNIQYRARWGEIDPNSKIMEIYDIMNRFSIVPFEKSEMLENMYRGFLEGVVDPYTQYFNAEALAAFYARTQGYFVGIGVMVSVEPDDPLVTIATTFQGGPAATAGVLPGDRIAAVDGTDVAGRGREEVIGMITGEENTDVIITVIRPYEHERIDITITRARVEVPSVEHEIIYTGAGRVGYIRIESFDLATVGQFDNAVAELYAAGVGGFIIDLRNNPGGALTAVNEIADRLIPEGIIVFTVDAAGNRVNSYADAYYLGMPLVLLVNERSASASEVLSGAVRDTGVGTIVGEQTFGKGIVQSLIPLSDGTAIKLTVQRYYTPSGESIHEIGITPHVIVEMPDILSRRIGSLPQEEDIQLQTALEVISEKF
jgi:carboxyl-terminal processing protease